MTKRETPAERQARIAKLKAMYESGEFDPTRVPNEVNLDRLVNDVASGTSEPERRLADLLKSSTPKR